MGRIRLLRAEDLNRFWQRYKFVLLAILAGALLLSLNGTGRGAEAADSGSREEIAFDLEVMERKLERALSQVSGAGRVSVVLSLKEGARQILAQDTKVTGSEQSTTAVVVSRGSGVEDPVLLQSVYPRYQGALVICDGADSAQVRLEMVDAVRVLTGLSAEKISICKRQ